MKTDYRKSHIHPEKGASYHSSFSDNRYRKMVWKQEQAVIDTILRNYFKERQINLLDFACGTGRILSYLEPRAKKAVGVDLSKSMLEVARENTSHAQIIEQDLTKNDVLGNRKFNLITAFRFFPNAQPVLRKEAMELLHLHLEDDGYLIFNNHRNVDSSLNRLLGLLGRNKYKGMSSGEVTKLTADAGLEIVEVYFIGVLPVTENKTILPVSLLRPIESTLSSVQFLQKLARNLIYLCRRSKG